MRQQLITVAYHANLNELQEEPALALLLSAPARRTPFERLAFWQGLVAHCGLRPMVAVARDTSSGKAAVLALAQAPDGLMALANYYSFRVGPILSPGADAPALIAAIASDLASHTARISLAPMGDEAGETCLVAEAFARAGWFVAREICDTNHFLDVAGRSFATYLATRPGPLRNTLKRKGKKVTCAVFTAFDEPAWAAYEAIYAQSWKPREGAPDFLRQFAAQEGAAGRLRLGLARAADTGAPLAAQLWTVEAGTAFIHKLAYIETAKPLSPGTSLSAALMAHVLDIDRVTQVDFGTGDDPYKADWMESCRPRYRLTMLRKSAPAQWPAIARACLKRRLIRLAGGRYDG